MVIIERCRKKYNSLPLGARASIWFAICNFAQRGISLITTPVFTRLMPTEEYGKYSVFNTWEQILLLIVSLSLYRSLMNLYVKRDNYVQTTSSVMGLNLTISLIWLVVVAIFCKPIASLLDMSQTMTLALFIYLLVLPAVNCWMILKRYTFDYKSIILYTLLTTGVIAALSIFLVAFVDQTAETRVLVLVCTTVIFGSVVVIKTLLKGKRFFDKEVWKFSLGFCCALLPHYLSEFVLSGSDKLMINYLCGASDVALYSVAYSLGSIINLITNAINASFGPYQYQKIEKGEFDKLRKTSNVVLALVTVILMGVVLFSKEIVYVFGGSKYISCYTVVAPICIGVFFNYTYQLFGRMQEYYEKKINLIIPSVCCAVMNLALNYLFIPIFGYQAAAYTTFISYMIFCVVHYVFYRRLCKEKLNGVQIFDIRVIVGLAVLLCGWAIIINIVDAVLNEWLKLGLLALLVVIVMSKRKTVIEFVRTIFQKEGNEV